MQEHRDGCDKKGVRQQIMTHGTISGTLFWDKQKEARARGINNLCREGIKH